MNEFHVARQEIEKIKQEAEQERITRKAAGTQRIVDEALEDSRRKDAQAAHTANLTLVLKTAPNLLGQVNKELFEGKESIAQWTEITSSHKHYETVYADYHDTYNISRNHSVRQLQTRLKISDLGDVVVFIPTEIGIDEPYNITIPSGFLGLSSKTETRTKLVWKPIEENHRNVYVSHTSSKHDINFVCVDNANRNMLIPLSDPTKDITTELTTAITEQVVQLHKEHYSEK